MKSLYKFNAKKYIKIGLEMGATPNFQWAMANDGKTIKINEELGMGALDGRIVMIEACDETGRETSENTTYLEEILLRSHKRAVAQLRECEEALEVVADERDELLDEINDLMGAHNALLDIINKHHDELPTEVVAEIAEKVVLKVLKSVAKKVENIEKHECDSDCSECNCR